MSSVKVRYLAFIFLALVFVVAISSVYTFDRDFGRLAIVKIEILDGPQNISGLLYRPESATSDNALPAVILVHGISSAKESMSSIALELAKRNMVALTIDVVGHGDSSGQLGDTGDLSLGTLAAVRYIKTQPYVSSSLIGLVGHSLGAGAVGATVMVEPDIRAIVLIAGGLGEMVTSSAYGVFNSSFPNNLLVAIGKQDVLFDLNQVMHEWLPPIFGSSQVVPGELYGDFSLGTARKLITPNTTHLLEPIDPTIVSETVNWFEVVLESRYMENDRLLGGFTYPYREAAMLIGIFAFVGMTCPILAYVSRRLSLKGGNAKTNDDYLSDWKILAIWGTLSIGLFPPMFFFGFLLPFPPLLFGSSFAWWLFAVGVVGFLFISLVWPKFFRSSLRVRTVIGGSLTWRSIFAAVILFVFMYLIVYLVDFFLGINLWIYVPIFRVLNSARIPVLLMFVPFFSVFFLVEGLFLHTLRIPIRKAGFSAGALALFKTIGVKVIPYVVLMSIQYFPMFLLDIKPLPSLAGFLIEFFPLITLQFIISTVYSWWFNKVTSSIGTGAVFNAVLFSWISAGAFPFGVFRL